MKFENFLKDFPRLPFFPWLNISEEIEYTGAKLSLQVLLPLGPQRESQISPFLKSLEMQLHQLLVRSFGYFED